MKLSSVTIEGIHKVDKITYHFDHLNYLQGPNGAGKSTALQAAQLALLGYIPNTGKTNEAIFRHANRQIMEVKVVLDDDGSPVTIRRSWWSTNKGVVSSVETSPEGYDIKSVVADLELPIFNFNEFVGMTANKLKEWFINFLPKDVTAINWEEELQSAAHCDAIVDETLIPSTIAAIEETGMSGIEQVRAANTLLKNSLTVRKQSLQRTQHTIQSLVYYDDCDSNVNETELRDELALLNKRSNDASQYVIIQQQNESILRRIRELDLSYKYATEEPQYIQAKERIGELNNLIAAEGEKVSYLNKIRADAMQQVGFWRARADSAKKSLAGGSAVCPYTSQPCETAAKHVDTYRKDLEDAESHLEELQKQVYECNSNIQQTHDTIVQYQRESRDCNERVQMIQNRYAESDVLRTRIQVLPDIDPADIEDRKIEARIQEIQDLLIRYEANQRYNKLIDELTVEKYKEEQSIEIINSWIKLTGANGLQTSMMKAPFLELGKMINKYLIPLFGEQSCAWFNLSEKANSFSFGIIRNNKYIPFDILSSGEKCLFTLALMMCIVAASESKLKVIMIDDLLDHLDTDNIATLFESLEKIDDIQFILAGVAPYIGENAEKVVLNVSEGVGQQE